MIAAHGATIDVTATTITVTYAPLITALNHTGASASTTLRISDIDDIHTQTPTSLDIGWARLGGHTIAFSPNQQDQLQQLVTLVESAKNGELPDQPSTLIAGLNFVAIDVETANNDWGSICQIGVARYTNGHLTETNSWLCTPPPGLQHFEDINISIHGITPDMLGEAPSFDAVLPHVTDFVGELPVVAHNAQFDMTAFSRACKAAKTTTPHWSFGCSLALARAAKLGIDNHRLPTVAGHFGITIDKHHDALSDARACGDIITNLAASSGFSGGGAFPEFFWGSGFTLGTLTAEKVQPVLRGDARGLNIAAQRAALGLGSDRVAGSGGVGSGAVAGSGGAGSEGPAESPGAKKRSRPAWEKAATPEVIPDTNKDADPDGALYGHNVTLTGDFEPYDKSMLWSAIAERGATIGKNVTKKTTILILGPWHTITSKQKRAEELIEKGQDIALWTAAELYKELGLDEEPPF